jgi:hypothetical protein
MNTFLSISIMISFYNSKTKASKKSQKLVCSSFFALLKIYFFFDSLLTLFRYNKENINP